MENYSKFNDINVVLKKAKSTLDIIEKRYNDSINNQEI